MFKTSSWSMNRKLITLSSLQMLKNTFEDFVMTPIKCPPPKIVAVKRYLKKPNNKSNLMDDDDSSIKADFINDNDSLSSFDSKDLIEFERDEPLIDLSEPDGPPTVEKDSTKDTFSSMNVKNSNTLLTLLDLLEIGNVMRTTERELLGRCAEDDATDRNPLASKTSSSSSLQNIPVGSPGACATSSGKTDKLSTVFPPSSVQPENPSIEKNCSRHFEKLSCDDSETLKATESIEIDDQRVREGIDVDDIDSTLRKSRQLQSEKLEENSISTSISFSCSSYNCSSKTCCCPLKKASVNSEKLSRENLNKENEKLGFFLYNHHQQQHSNDVSLNVIPDAQSKVQAKKVVDLNEESDTNNNQESVCNQNSLEEASSSSRVNHDGFTNHDDESNESLKFLSPHTSQRKLPPKFYSSTSSLNQDCFEASSRLKRLEERFKGFSYTKKLLRSSKVFSKSEEILSTYGRAKEFKLCESLNSSIQFPLPSTTLSENCLRQLTEDELEAQSDYKDIDRVKKASSIDGISGEYEIKNNFLSCIFANQ